MKTTSKIIAAAAFTILAAAGAQAETYDGVHQLTSGLARADVAAEATVAARAGNVYGDGVSSNVAPALTASVDRAVVREQAVAAAHNPLQSLDRRAFYRDQVPAAYSKPTVSFTRQAAL
ncbi:alpha/beta hydrolase [Variovorax sp. RT4R15]|uniref:alpha/beta hydrolase n=1 Tax=Variovorax sp. RT4R15 TaxID=3443737 RepID=UPI003F47A18E